MKQMTLAVVRLTLAAALTGGMSLGHAQVLQVKTQVPGYYRLALGDFEVTALHDGQIKLDAKILKNASAQEIQRLIARMFRENPTATAVNAFLVNTGRHLVLVDSGAAGLFGPTVGQVLVSLKAAGYEPGQIDTVLLTHLHPDHAGGLLGPNGQPAFPKATVHVAKAEADFWLNPDIAAKGSQDMKGRLKMLQDATAPYVKAGTFKSFDGPAELVPGIRPVAAAGHTPGHSGYLVESKGQKLLIWGDVVHNAAVQFAKPEVTIEFDQDARQAYKTRKALFQWTAKDALLVAGAHLPFPGLGHVRAEPRGQYTWVPLDFAPWPEPQPAAAKP